LGDGPRDGTDGAKVVGAPDINSRRAFSSFMMSFADIIRVFGVIWWGRFTRKQLVHPYKSPSLETMPTSRFIDSSTLEQVENELSVAVKSAASGSTSENDPIMHAVYQALSHTPGVSNTGLDTLHRLSATQLEAKWWLCACYLEKEEYFKCRVNLVALVLDNPAYERGAALLEVYKARVWARSRETLVSIGRVCLGCVFVVVLARALLVRGGGRGGGSRKPIAEAVNAVGAHVSAAIQASGGPPPPPSATMSSSDKIISGVMEITESAGTSARKALGGALKSLGL
jgi:hypothetical protein